MDVLGLGGWRRSRVRSPLGSVASPAWARQKVAWPPRGWLMVWAHQRRRTAPSPEWWRDGHRGVDLTRSSSPPLCCLAWTFWARRSPERADGGPPQMVEGRRRGVIKATVSASTSLFLFGPQTGVPVEMSHGWRRTRGPELVNSEDLAARGGGGGGERTSEAAAFLLIYRLHLHSPPKELDQEPGPADLTLELGSDQIFTGFQQRRWLLRFRSRERRCLLLATCWRYVTAVSTLV